MKLKILQLSVFLFVGSLQSQIIDPYKFYPSAVGNKWRWFSYSSSSTYDSEITKDSLAQNGSRYLFLNGSISAQFIADTSRQIWQVIDNKPVLWYKLDAQPGDSFTVSMAGNSYKVKVSSATADAFGQAVPAKVFSWSYGDAYPNYAVHWLVYGIGFYSTVSSIYNLNDIVTGYAINGVKFGTLASIELVQKTIPSGFALEQNFPNPFNPTTMFRFSLAKDVLVNLEVFDMLGHNVRTLLNEEKPAGVYQVSFSSGALPSGVYLVRMRAGTFENIRKILLTK